MGAALSKGFGKNIDDSQVLSGSGGATAGDARAQGASDTDLTDMGFKKQYGIGDKILGGAASGALNGVPKGQSGGPNGYSMPTIDYSGGPDPNPNPYSGYIDSINRKRSGGY